MDYLRNLGDRMLNAVPDILAALLILLVAFLVAWLVKWLVVKILKTLKIDQRLNRLDAEGSKGGSTAEYIGKLVFIIVFILFLPSVFSRLGLTSVGEPIGEFVTAIGAFIPNLLAAGLILFIGFFVAKIVRQLLVPLLQRVGVDRVQQRQLKGDAVRPEGGETSRVRLSTVIGNIVYVIILIPIVIAALEVLQIEAISRPAITMLDQVFNFIPKIIAALVVIGIGFVIARFVGNLLTQLLNSVGADGWVNRMLPAGTEKPKFSLSKALGMTVQVVILLFFIVEGINLLDLVILQTIGTAVIGYLPNLLVAGLILIAAWYFATWLEGFINLRLSSSGNLGVFAKAAVLVLAFFVIFDQLNIAKDTVNTAFQLLMAGTALAFALAFGLGGREFAQRSLRKMSDRADAVAQDFRQAETRRTDEEIFPSSDEPPAGPYTPGGPVI